MLEPRRDEPSYWANSISWAASCQFYQNICPNRGRTCTVLDRCRFQHVDVNWCTCGVHISEAFIIVAGGNSKTAAAIQLYFSLLSSEAGAATSTMIIVGVVVVAVATIGPSNSLTSAVALAARFRVAFRAKQRTTNTTPHDWRIFQDTAATAAPFHAEQANQRPFTAMLACFLYCDRVDEFRCCFGAPTNPLAFQLTKASWRLQGWRGGGRIRYSQ